MEGEGTCSLQEREGWWGGGEQVRKEDQRDTEEEEGEEKEGRPGSGREVNQGTRESIGGKKN